jgi:TonB family protein
MFADRKIFWLALAVTAVVHALIAVALATATGTAELEPAQSALQRKLCGDARCAEKPMLWDRRLPDEGAAADVGVIEATVVPMLGMAEAKAGELPKLTKYEQPERIEEAVNVSKDNANPEDVKNKAELAKKAELDRQRKDRTLAALLGAPEDDDPRRRPTELAKIVGQRDGSVYGSGTEWKEGNVYGGKVALALRREFTVPPFLSDADLRKLRVRVRVKKLTEAGQILDFEVLDRSGNAQFDAAAVAAIKRFVPKEGGTAYLPAPDAKTLGYVNQNGMVVDLDGALFRR